MGFNMFYNNNRNNYKKKIISLIHYVFKLIAYLVICFSIYNIVLYFISNKLLKQNVNFLSHLIKRLIIALSYIYFEIKQNKIKSIISEINKSLSENNRKSLIICAKILTIIWITWFIAHTIIILYYRSHFGNKAIIDIYLIHDILITYYMFGWIIATNLLLIHISYAIYLLEKRLFINNHDINAINYVLLDQNLLTIERLKKSINETLGIFPFLWFCELFSATCLRLTYVSVNTWKGNRVILGLVEYTLIAFMDISYLLMTNYFQSMRPTVDKLRICIDSNYNSMDGKQIEIKKIIIKNFNNYYSINYKAFNVFTINIKFLFAFMSTVINFTVMLIQLLNT